MVWTRTEAAARARSEVVCTTTYTLINLDVFFTGERLVMCVSVLVCVLSCICLCKFEISCVCI